jgi:hypothetical protein
MKQIHRHVQRFVTLYGKRMKGRKAGKLIARIIKNLTVKNTPEKLERVRKLKDGNRRTDAVSRFQEFNMKKIEI